MNRIKSVPKCDPQGIWIPSEQFSRYAESDLDRWRQIIGHHVIHNDARWGIGEVMAVSWGTCCDHVPAYVQIKIRYQGGWTIIGHSATWHWHHQDVSVSAIVEAAIRKCLDPDLSDDERAECLSHHARELREQKDREALDHVARMKQRVPDKLGVDTEPENADHGIEFNC